MGRRLISLLVFLSAFFAVTAYAETPVPPLEHRFTDAASTVAPHERARIEALLEEFEKSTGGQIAILTVPTLGDEDIFPYSQRVFETWKLGRKGADDGILIVVVKDRLDRGLGKSVRIHTGRGYEGSVPDAVATRIVVEGMKPLMKSGDYAGAFSLGTQRLRTAVVEGSGGTASRSAPAASAKAPRERPEDLGRTVAEIVISLFAFGLAAVFSPLAAGIVAALCTFLLLPAELSAGVLAALTVLAFFVGYVVALPIRFAIGAEPSGGGFDGFGPFGSSGSGRSSGSSGFSGFSGGGGDSAGGGGGD